MAVWGQYPYYADESDPLLADMVIVEDSDKGTLGVAGYDSHSNTIIVAFRGSDNIQNWLEDFDFLKEDYTLYGCNDCEVHAGFYKTYLALQDGLLA
mmetsp:Transcript_41342/g.39811  ORF Transcript_41342/g.39811 Transcript_41342/m.39811 type:complete len:96 (-) Transcript_41342:453-740(-)